ncbi:AMP-binding protein [Paracoccus xiamenensis]|uniref:AMP-binding protein n=1 Tax=Paracoccus xiamenensis TaxID=2714901 RepID=UPI00140789AB|nr:AMP-binding protein [Paracoccus xiamenensis]NHF73181.1 AMP-binding protein [Paracoccus xiamenensis]
MTGLLDHFARAAARFPDRIAIVDGRGHETSFAELKARADSFAARWRDQGIGPGHRVLIARAVDADLYASLAALWALGAVAVLPEPAMGLAGLRHAARVTRPKAFCTGGWYRALGLLLSELWRVPTLASRPGSAAISHGPASPGDIALISFTSGSTGQPKAIPRSHGFLMAQYDAIAPLLRSERAERDLVAFPVFTLINIAAGQTSILPNWKMSRLATLPPHALRDWMVRQRVTRALIPPALCERLAEAGLSGGLHQIFTGGGPVFPDLLARLQRPDGPRITCVYGSTEAEPIAHLDAAEITTADHAAMSQGQGLLVGRPVPNLQLRIRDHEIQVAGAHVNPGYLDPTHDAGNKLREGDTIWHRTGDAGRLDDQGRLWLLGRIGSQVTIAGAPRFPFQIETAARQWPGVTQAALLDHGGTPVLALSGQRDRLPQWRDAASGIGIGDIRHFDRLPMDRRHASKIDLQALREMLNGR